MACIIFLLDNTIIDHLVQTFFIGLFMELQTSRNKNDLATQYPHF